MQIPEFGNFILTKGVLRKKSHLLPKYQTQDLVRFYDLTVAKVFPISSPQTVPSTLLYKKV